eukprot:1860433-Pleurochrysis_carterae.AAC.3
MPFAATRIASTAIALPVKRALTVGAKSGMFMRYSSKKDLCTVSLRAEAAGLTAAKGTVARVRARCI